MSLNLRIKLILFTLYSVLHINVSAQTFSVSAPSEVQLGQQFAIKYTVDDGDFDDIKLPSFEGFKLVGGPNRSNNFSMINGVTSRKSSLEYRFLAVQKGTLVVQPATAIINGKSYTSRQLVIKVQGEMPQPQNLEGSKDLFVRVEVEPKNHYYIGQQLLLKYKLYYSQEVRMNEILDEDTYPNMMQQYVQLNGNESATTMVNGKQYNVATFKAIALYPQKVGALNIKPMVVQVGIADETSEDLGFFTSRSFTPVNLTSNELKFDIKPWPENAPPSFTGAVGKYEMSIYLDKNSVKPNGTATLQISVQGNGYPRTINGPIQSFGADIEVYEPKKVDGESGYSDNEIKHTTSFEYYLIPKKEGTFSINPKFTYLDPELGKYVTLDSTEIRMNVSNQAQSDGSNEESDFQESVTSSTQNGSRLYGLFGALVFGLIGIGLWWKFLRKPSPKLVKPVVLKTLKLDKKDPKLFHKALAEELYQKVAIKYNVAPKDFNVYHITALLNGQGKKEASLLFEEIIQACDLAVYGGLITDESMNTLQHKADQLSNLL